LEVKKGCWTPLYTAIDNNHDKIVKELLDNGADVNAIADFGNNMIITPMSLAI